MNGYIDIVKLLEDVGANIHTKNIHDKNAQWYIKMII